MLKKNLVSNKNKKIFFKSRKGSALIMVMLILTVGLLLSGVLMSYTTTSYKRTLSDNNVEMSYYGADSALEKLMDYIDNNKDTIATSIVYNDDDDFSDKIADEFETKALSLSLNDKVDTDNTNDVVINIEEIKALKYEEVDASTLKITLGIKISAKLKNGIFNSSGKTLFGKKDIEVKKSMRFYLKSALNTIGDIFVDGGHTPLSPIVNEGASNYNYRVNIIGDVNTYGSTPSMAGQSNQWYYGGIMVKSNAYLNINGSAYVRSLIRAGLYDGVNYDNSRIDIAKDAITQGVQIFGMGDRIVVSRDVYTLDDVEINGPDSVIAINGTYFGVSNGSESMYHDASSAIVNSATVHDLASDPTLAKKSRIVINGNVMVNGGTFKLDTDGITPIGQIEDASAAWNQSDDVELYRSYSKWITNPLEYLQDPNSYIKEKKSEAIGYGTLFQIWNNRTDVDNWLNDINQIRNYNTSYPSNKNIDAFKNNKIKGYCKYVLAANDKLKIMDKNSEANSDITRIDLSSILANFPEQFEEMLDFWNDGISYATEAWALYVKDDLIGGIGQKLTDLKNALLNGMKKYNTEFFVDRSLEALGTQIKNKINLRQGSSYNSYYEYLVGAVKAKGNNVSLASDDAYTLSLNSEIDPAKYQVIVSELKKDIIVDRDFNGLIITNGRVKITRGVTINGSIIAAGNGFNSTSITTIEDANVPNLNNGDYAAVYFDPTIGIGDTNIIFTNREDLLQKIIDSGGPDLKSLI